MLKSSWLLVFILKTYFEKIFAKLNNQGVAATFFLKYLKHFENGEMSSAWKLLKLTGLKGTPLVIKKLIFLKI